jgi:hypothetical protein
MVLAACKAHAHGWYDHDCCGDQDCAPVTETSFVAYSDKALPLMVVTTKYGTKAVTEDTKIRDSKDNQMHACIYRGMLLCLYLPPGN